MKRAIFIITLAALLIITAGCSRSAPKEAVATPQTSEMTNSIPEETVSFSESKEDPVLEETTVFVEEEPNIKEQTDPTEESEVQDTKLLEKEVPESTEPEKPKETEKPAESKEPETKTTVTKETVPPEGPETDTQPAESTKPEPAKEPDADSEPDVTEEPKETEAPREENTEQEKKEEAVPTGPEPTDLPFDINYWVSFAKNYASQIGLNVSADAAACWDNPITAGAHSKYLERDIADRLSRYNRDEDITDVWIWAEKRSDGSYDLYIGYA